jgi:hypothetical protein
MPTPISVLELARRYATPDSAWAPPSRSEWADRVLPQARQVPPPLTYPESRWQPRVPDYETYGGPVHDPMDVYRSMLNPPDYQGEQDPIELFERTPRPDVGLGPGFGGGLAGRGLVRGGEQMAREPSPPPAPTPAEPPQERRPPEGLGSRNSGRPLPSPFAFWRPQRPELPPLRYADGGEVPDSILARDMGVVPGNPPAAVTLGGDRLAPPPRREPSISGHHRSPSEGGVADWLRDRWGAPQHIANQIGALAPWTPMGGAFDAGQMVGAGIEAGSPAEVGLGTGFAALAALPFGVRAPVRMPPRISTPIRAYHGSPHAFDEFRLDRIGTGEGAQAYGHGLYFAESEPVARSYRDALTTPPDHFAHGLRDDVEYQVSQAVRRLRQEDSAYTIRELRERVRDLAAVDMLPAYSDDAFDRLVSSGHIVPPGHMYEVNLHARPEQFLDWDAPLSGQSGFVRDRLPMDVWNDIHHPASRRGYDAAATQAFSDAGIPGVRYLDQGSRGAGQGTRNYVVFDPSMIEILRRYGLAAPVAGAGTAATLMSDRQQGQ